jgi:hypothetical protein
VADERAKGNRQAAPHRAGQNIGDDQDYSGLSEEELVRAVREHLEADDTLDPSEIEIEVDSDAGRVTLRGAVSSEVERETAERIITDIIGLDVAADFLRVDRPGREGTPEVMEPSGEGGEHVTGFGAREMDATPTGRDIAQVDQTEDAMESMDEGLPFVPPDSPMPEAMAATDPAHGFAADQPRPTQPTGRGRRSAQVDELVAQALTETDPRTVARAGAEDNASTFKDRMREVAESRDRRGEGRANAGDPGGRDRGERGRGE